MLNAFGSSCSLSPEGLILLIMKKVTFTQIQLYNDLFLMVFETSGVGTGALRGAGLQDFSWLVPLFRGGLTCGWAELCR